MFDQIEATGNWSSVYMLLDYRGVDTSVPGELTRADVDMTVLVPAYMLGELKVGFLMGFRVYLPFLVIDMVIASILISMSMMMLPPGADQPAVQAAAVRAGRRVDAGGREPARDLRAGRDERPGESAQAAVLPLLLIPVAVRRCRDRSGKSARGLAGARVGPAEREGTLNVRRIRGVCRPGDADRRADDHRRPSCSRAW
jgi:hypothetical protein